MKTKFNAPEKQSFLPPLWVLTLACIALLLWLLAVLKELVVLLIVGYTIAYVVEPVLKILERRGVARLWSFFLILTVFLVIVGVLFATTWPTLIREGAYLVDKLPSYVELAESKTAGLLSKYSSAEGGLNSLVSFPFERLQEFAAKILPGVFEGIKTALLGGYSMTLAIVNLALLPFIVFYLTQSFPDLYTNFINLIPRSKRKQVVEVLSAIDSQVAAFVRGQLLVASILFSLFAVGLGLIGVELWLVLAVIAGFGNLIPYAGTVVGIVLCSIMALVTFGDFIHVIYVWILFVVVQVLEGSFITPRIIGRSVGMHPLIIILAIVACGSLFGLLGIMLAVPIAASLGVLFKQGHKWWVMQVDSKK